MSPTLPLSQDSTQFENYLSRWPLRVPPAPKVSDCVFALWAESDAADWTPAPRLCKARGSLSYVRSLRRWDAGMINHHRWTKVSISFILQTHIIPSNAKVLTTWMWFKGPWNLLSIKSFSDSVRMPVVSILENLLGSLCQASAETTH